MEPRYRKPFIVDSIIKVDFVSPVEVDEAYVEGRLADVLKDRYPIAEPEHGVTQQVTVTEDGMSHTRTKRTVWHMYAEHRDERQVGLATDSLFVSHRKYSSWTDLKGDFTAGLRTLAEDFPDMEIGRLGVRYVDLITLQKPAPFDWSGYIDPALAAPLAFPTHPERLSRLMQVMELSYPDDIRIKFQYGMPNPDYPSTIRQKTFVLDVDAFVQRLLKPSDVIELLDPMHAACKELFEASVDDDLRCLMEPIEDA